MESAKQRIRAAVARKKQEEKIRGEETPPSVPKPVGKVGVKRKTDGTDDRSGKKVASSSEVKPTKKPSPPKMHGVGKGLMTASGAVIPQPVRHLLTHKDYTVEVAESILKEEEVELCDEQATDEIGSSALFDLTWVYTFFSLSGPIT